MLMFRRISKMHVMNCAMLVGMVFLLFSVPELFVYLCMLLYYVILLLCMNGRTLIIGKP